MKPRKSLDRIINENLKTSNNSNIHSPDKPKKRIVKLANKMTAEVLIPGEACLCQLPDNTRRWCITPNEYESILEKIRKEKNNTKAKEMANEMLSPDVVKYRIVEMSYRSQPGHENWEWPDLEPQK